MVRGWHLGLQTEGLMSPDETVADRLLEAVRHAPDCTLEELVQKFRDISWSNVYLQIDRLSRSGQVRLIRRGVGSYTITLRVA